MQTKKKTGRPSKYKEEYNEQLIAHMSQGLSFETFAAVIDVNVDTLHEWAKVHPSFSDSKKVAFTKNQLFYERMGIAMMAGKIDKASAVVWIFNMKNRFGWRDKKEIFNDNPDHNKVVFFLPKEEQMEDIDSKVTNVDNKSNK